MQQNVKLIPYYMTTVWFYPCVALFWSIFASDSCTNLYFCKKPNNYDRNCKTTIHHWPDVNFHCHSDDSANKTAS